MFQRVATTVLQHLASKLFDKQFDCVNSVDPTGPVTQIFSEWCKVEGFVKQVTVKCILDEKMFSHELSIIQHLDGAACAPKFYGSAKTTTNAGIIYQIITEYFANNLKEFFLRQPIPDWNFRYKMAYAISVCINDLHESGVAHQKLQASEFICDGIGFKIQGFAHAKKISALETIENEKKIDIHQLGNIFWQIATCHIPDLTLTETNAESIPLTCPKEFAELIRQCWSGEITTRSLVSRLKYLSENHTQLKEIDYKNLVFGSLLDKGYEGSVFKGTYQGRPVAIKQFKYKIVPTDHSGTIFPFQCMPILNIFTEATNLAYFHSLSEAITVKVEGYGFNPGCIVTELMPRGTLTGVLRQEPFLSIDIRLRMATTLCKGIKALHDLGIFHSDIKSKNILLDQNYCSKLIDFGFMTDSKQRKFYGYTIPYAAPEILTFKRVSAEADVYSFGLVLFEIMLNNSVKYQKLFYSAHDSDYANKKDDILAGEFYREVNAELRRIKKRRNHIPELVTLVRNCIHSDPSKRPTITYALSVLQKYSMGLSCHSALSVFSKKGIKQQIYPGKKKHTHREHLKPQAS